jgi:hypothetical protein
MGSPTKDNPSGSPMGNYSLLNLVIKGVDAITGFDRDKSIKNKKKYFEKNKNYQQPRNVGKVD